MIEKVYANLESFTVEDSRPEKEGLVRFSADKMFPESVCIQAVSSDGKQVEVWISRVDARGVCKALDELLG